MIPDRKFLLYVAVLLSLAAALAGCGATIQPQESAMEWMQRQPLTNDP